MSYGPASSGYRQSHRLSEQILRGAKPADLPVLKPNKFELVINSRTAIAWASRFRSRYSCPPPR